VGVRVTGVIVVVLVVRTGLRSGAVFSLSCAQGMPLLRPDWGRGRTTSL